ncbi:hypothetical protein K0T92_14015 [Paenibacillus oenotherae]|uniref:Lipoprotein n=1 Tax=Paenibacillus oenotherae TaxID=1435645 RepID=A0ABS7D7V3_9BACL|nr:DUF6612 family protein [Paenibacillus oenotherae]MBW7475858.1 hypothetical protein [Paenibacillus oenotherae]
MKKLFITCVLVMSMIGLAACGAQEENAAGTSKPGESGKTEVTGSGGVEQPVTAVEEKDEPAGGSVDTEEILNKSILASREIKSMAIDGRIKMSTEDAAGKVANIDTSIKVEIIMNPLNMRKVMKMNMEGKIIEVAMYGVDDQFYMMNSAAGEQWVKYPAGMAEEMRKAMMQSQSDPGKEMERMKLYADEFNLTEEDGVYVMHMAIEGDKFKQLFDELMQSYSPGAETADRPDMNVKSMELTYTIDKTTFYPTQMNLKSVMEIGSGDKKMKMTQAMEVVYFNMNGVSKIELPEAAKQAIEMPDTMLPQ